MSVVGGAIFSGIAQIMRIFGCAPAWKVIQLVSHSVSIDVSLCHDDCYFREFENYIYNLIYFRSVILIMLHNKNLGLSQ